MKYAASEKTQYTAEERDHALSVSLTSLAAQLGFSPVRVGSNKHSLKEMDSLIIYNDRTWNRFSGKGNITGGTQIDFMMEFGGCDSVVEAIHMLLDYKGIPQAVQEMPETVPGMKVSGEGFVLPGKADNYRRLYAYLMKTRKLSYEVIDYFVNRKKLLYESKEHHNLVFLGKDRQGMPRHASMRGTADLYAKVFKGDVPGSNKDYGMNIVNEDSADLCVFESGIDCMSYMDVTKDFTSNKLVLSMVADNPLVTFLKENKHIKRIFFCLDADIAGRKNTQKYMVKYAKEGYFVRNCPPVAGKDYNELLKTIVSSSREEAAELIKKQLFVMSLKKRNRAR